MNRRLEWPSVKLRKLLSLGVLSLLSAASVPFALVSAEAQVFTEPGGSRRQRINEIKLTPEENHRTMGAPTLKDLFPYVNMNLQPCQPYALEGMKLNGLGNRSTKILGFYHLVGLQCTPFETMSALYAENKSSGRSSFVSVDPLVHCYFSLSNTLTLKVVDQTLYPELMALLKALIDSCVRDYRSCEIAEVKDDIQRNLAFVIVGIKLLDPKIVLPDLGGASDLAKLELACIAKGGDANSPVFNRMQDYDSFKPIGFWKENERAANYFRSAAWLSSMYLTLTDVTNNSQAGGGNTFRRAVLLYRAMELGRISRPGGGVSLMDAWQRLVEVHNAVSQTALSPQNTVYLRDVRTMFQNGKLEFRDLLNALAQPLSRARLLLSIKKQRPQGLTSTSIFEIDRGRRDDENQLVMRFLPPVNCYELEWLRNQSQTFKEESDDGAVSPLSLFLFYSWGAPAASNLLNSMVERLDPSLMLTVPELTRVAGRNHAEADVHSAVCQAEKRWAVITEYFRPYRKSAQTCLNTDIWMNQRLLSASAAFVDSFCAVEKGPDPDLNSPAAKAPLDSKLASKPEVKEAEARPSVAARMAALASGAALPNSASPEAKLASRKGTNFHYLEPCPELFRKLGGFIAIAEGELTRLNAFPEDMRSRLDDFVRLNERLAHIADTELAVQPITLSDFNLLGNIDKILASLGSSPLGSVFLPSASGGSGVTMASGEPTVLYAILTTDQGPYLGRGALYSYYELTGGPFKKEHWARKKTYGFLRPPGWISRVDIINDAQSSVPVENAAPASSVKPALKSPSLPAAGK